MDSQLSPAPFHFKCAFGNRLHLRRDQLHKGRLLRNCSGGRHAPLQIVPRHMQLPRGSINPFLLSHLDSSRPKLSGYSRFPPTIGSPFFETHSCFLKADDGGFASRHGLPPRRKTQRKNDLNSYRPNTSYTFPGNSQNYPLFVAKRLVKGEIPTILSIVPPSATFQ